MKRLCPLFSLLLLISGLSGFFVSGCGGSSGGGNNINDNVNDNTNQNNNNADTGPLEVILVEPAEGDTDVPIDETIQISFSRELDPSTVDEATVRVTTGGVDAVGRLITDRQSVLFTPAELDPEASYTVTVSTDVADASGLGLETEFTSTFTTGQTARDGSGPSDDSAIDLVRDPFIYAARKQEYVLLGVDHSNVSKDLFVIDPLAFNEYEPEPDPGTQEPIPYSVEEASLNDTDWKMGTAGNLDDDLYDEVVYLTQPYDEAIGMGDSGTLHVFDYDDATGYARQTLSLDLTLPGGGWHQYDLAVGDLDDDPWDEIVVAGATEHGEARLWVIDDQLAGHTVLRSMDILGDSEGGSNWTGTDGVRVDIGNVKGDMEEEIVLTITAVGSMSGTLRVIDDLTATWESLDAHDMPEMRSFGLHSISSTGEEGLWGDVALGDVNGDGTDEIIWGFREATAVDNAGTGADYCRVQIEASVWRLDANGLELFGQAPPMSGIDENVATCSGHIPAAFDVLPLDIDGDQRAEVLVEGKLLEYDAGADDIVLMDHSVSFFGASASTAPLHVTVGDANGDSGDDIIMARRDGSIDVWGLRREQYGTDNEGNPLYNYYWEQIDDQDRSGAANQDYGIVVAANLDRDSRIVSPERDPDGDPLSSVKKEVVFSDDRIVAVIAAPPCAEGIGQNTDACEMGLGHSTGSSTTTGTSFSVWAGISVGVEVEKVALVITVAKFAAKVSLSAEYSMETSTTRSVEQTISDFAAYGEDLVIFYTVPQTRYTYTVSSHPNQDRIGTEIHVNVPMAPRLFAVTREFYNSNNSGQPDIGDTILPVIPGDLTSYPTYQEAQDILDNNESLGITSPPVSVNQGDGYKALELVVSEEYTTSETVTISTEAEVEFCGATVCVGAAFGTSGGLFSESSYSTSTAFMSSVGALDEDHWAEHLYDFGLFAYIHDSEALNQTFTVVSSYVD